MIPFNDFIYYYTMCQDSIRFFEIVYLCIFDCIVFVSVLVSSLKGEMVHIVSWLECLYVSISVCQVICFRVYIFCY